MLYALSSVRKSVLMRQPLTIALVGLAVWVGSSAHADVVYSNLSGTGTYDISSVVTVRGDNVGLGARTIAASFTPTAPFTLDSIDLGISSDENPAISDDMMVVLAESNAGEPGSVIESLGTVSGFPPITTSDSFLATATSTTNPLLQTGVEYFVVVSAANLDAVAFWYWNNQGALGYFSQSNLVNPWVEFSDRAQPAFRVNGTLVPEPAAALWWAGAALLASTRRARRGTNA